jgi:hypothetical protein
MVEAFLDAEAVLGPTPDDDTQRLNAWEDEAAEFAPWTLLRLRNVLRQDESGYHAQCFARARRGEVSGAEFEAMVAAELAQALSSSSHRKAAVAAPALVFQDDALFVAAPPGDGIVVNLSGRDRLVAAGGRLALPMPWPSIVTWKRAGAQGVPETMPLALLSEDRRLLAFDTETGRLLRVITISCAQSSAPIDATEIALIAAAPFSVREQRALALGKRLSCAGYG